MNLLKSAKFIAPFLILFLLLSLLSYELYSAKSNELPSALIGERVPAFKLGDLSQKDLIGKVSLLNVWATWCYACKLEHSMLMKIKNQYHVPIYGIAYKDQPDEVANWLTAKGNPYIKLGNDQQGDVAIDLGVYGTPETFVINPKGEIIYRHIGAINQDVWDKVLYPIIHQYQDQ
jgi:cytochrome c biogenesis protein CcmG/thiol:disulfide interchange protein DsbE